jgi:hypothetical protein
MMARVMELPGIEKKQFDHYQGKKLKDALDASSGHAGHVYLQYLVQPDMREFVLRALDERLKRLWAMGDFNGDDRYRVNALACMDIGARLAVHLGLIRVDVERVMDWLLGQMRDADVAGAKLPRLPWQVQALVEYLREMREHTLVMPGSWRDREGRPVELNKKELRIRHEIKDKKYYLAQEPFRKWVTRRQQNYQEIVKWLTAEEVVVNRSKLATLAAGTAMPGGQVYCVEVDGTHRLLTGAVEEVTSEKVVHLHYPMSRRSPTTRPASANAGHFLEQTEE